MLLGRPSRMPVSASPAITPARITDGSAPVSTTKNATVPSPSANRGQRDSRSAAPSATIGASTIATLPPETTSRCERPVARKSRSRTGSSLESSPSASPISRPASRGGREDSIERPTTERNDWAHRTGAKAAGPSRSNSSTSSSAEMPRRSRNSANPPSSTGRTDPETRTRSPRTASGALVATRQPDGLANARRALVPHDRADVEHRRPPIALGRRIDTERPLDGDRTRDARDQRVPDAVLVHAPPADREQQRPDQGGQQAEPGRPTRARGRRRHRGSRIASSGAISPARSSDPRSTRRSGAIATASSNRAPPPESHTHGSANRPTTAGAAGRPRTRPRAPA